MSELVAAALLIVFRGRGWKGRETAGGGKCLPRSRGEAETHKHTGRMDKYIEIYIICICICMYVQQDVSFRISRHKGLQHPELWPLPHILSASRPASPQHTHTHTPTGTHTHTDWLNTQSKEMNVIFIKITLSLLNGLLLWRNLSSDSLCLHAQCGAISVFFSLTVIGWNSTLSKKQLTAWLTDSPSPNPSQRRTALKNTTSPCLFYIRLNDEHFYCHFQRACTHTTYTNKHIEKRFFNYWLQGRKIWSILSSIHWKCHENILDLIYNIMYING